MIFPIYERFVDPQTCVGRMLGNPSGRNESKVPFSRNLGGELMTAAPLQEYAREIRFYLRV